ncbi:MAG: ATP-binding cassette domain-containing protein [Pseudomonadota bacterium]|jgi:phospholipid/cholesterol/gamma-HCH transport system ATP-binding protein|nr:ATP-binding cassette domain-containing protein [Pseudomonadota bacterium]
MIEAPPKIRLKNLHKRFGDKVVLNGLNLDVQKGESVVIIGGSGSGKSVSLKCLLGLLTPDGGDIQIDGKSIIGISEDDRDEINKKFGMLFQHAALFDSMTVLNNVTFGLTRGKGVSAEEAETIAYTKLEQVGLDESFAHRIPAELSGGQRKRVGLARAVALEPEIILFDEPTTGLDPVMGDIINELIVECTRDLGATTLTITHDMASSRIIADRIAMLYQGKIVWAGPRDKVDISGDPRVDQFINGRTEGPIKMELRRL